MTASIEQIEEQYLAESQEALDHFGCSYRAVHEATHAVVAAYLRVPFLSVTVKPSKLGSGDLSDGHSGGHVTQGRRRISLYTFAKGDVRGRSDAELAQIRRQNVRKYLLMTLAPKARWEPEGFGGFEEDEKDFNNAYHKVFDCRESLLAELLTEARKITKIPYVGQAISEVADRLDTEYVAHRRGISAKEVRRILRVCREYGSSRMEYSSGKISCIVDFSKGGPTTDITANPVPAEPALTPEAYDNSQALVGSATNAVPTGEPCSRVSEYRVLDADIVSTASSAMLSMEDLCKKLGQMRALLSQRGANKDERPDGLPTWTQYFEQFRNRIGLGIGLRAVQKRLKEMSGPQIAANSESRTAIPEPKAKRLALSAHDRRRLVEAAAVGNEIVTAWERGGNVEEAVKEYKKIALDSKKLDGILEGGCPEPLAGFERLSVPIWNPNDGKCGTGNRASAMGLSRLREKIRELDLPVTVGCVGNGSVNFGKRPGFYLRLEGLSEAGVREVLKFLGRGGQAGKEEYWRIASAGSDVRPCGINELETLCNGQASKLNE